jgi:tetratricopeptide (TPR) repeat protein
MIDSYDKRVAPGKVGRISITYKVKGGVQKINNKVYVETNIPDVQTITFIVTGNIVETPAEVQVIPRALIFGEIDGRDTPVTGTVRLQSYFDKVFHVTDIIPPNENTKIKLDTIEEGKEYKINIEVHPPFKKGDHGEEVNLKTDLKERPVIIFPYVYSFNSPKGFKQIIKDKFSKILLRGSFSSSKDNVKSRLRQLEKLEERATEIRESSLDKKGAEQVATREEFYGLMHDRANMAMNFLTEFSPVDLNEDDLKGFLEIAKVAKDEEQIFNISKMLFEKFPESKSDLNLMKTFFMNSCLFEPGEVVKYVNMDMFTPMDQLWMYYMIALGFSEWGNTEEAMNYIEKAETFSRLVSSDPSIRDFIPILQIATVRALVLKKVGDNEGAYKVIEYARRKLTDNNDDNAVQQIEAVERRLNVLGKEAPSLGTQYWSGIENPIKLLDLKGKVVLIEFSTCNYEQSNIDSPYLLRLQEEVNNDDFMIVGVIDSRSCQLGSGISDERKYEYMIDNYREAQKIDWPVSISKDAFCNYGVSHTPDFVIIDKKGIVRDGYFISNYSYLKKKIIELLEES